MKYSGSCQCGKVSFDVDTTIEKVIACNCSRCRRIGSLLAAADADNFTLKSGKDALTTYQFNKHVINHNFCSACGVQTHSTGNNPKTGKAMVMVNVRAIEGVDPESLPVMKFDGAKM